MKAKDLIQFICKSNAEVVGSFEDLVSKAQCVSSPTAISLFTVAEGLSDGLEVEVLDGLWVYHLTPDGRHEFQHLKSWDAVTQKVGVWNIPLNSCICCVFEVRENGFKSIDLNTLKPLKFQVISKIVVTDEDRKNCDFRGLFGFEPNSVLCYHINFKLSSFFVSEKQFSILQQLNLVDAPPVDVEIMTFSFAKWRWGYKLSRNLQKSFREFSVLQVRKAQVEMFEMPDTLMLRAYECDWYEGSERRNDPKLTLLDTLEVNLLSREILSHKIVKASYLNFFNDDLESFNCVIQELQGSIGREFQTIPNLFGVYECLDFYPLDFGGRRKRKIEFVFDNGVDNNLERE